MGRDGEVFGVVVNTSYNIHTVRSGKLKLEDDYCQP